MWAYMNPDSSTHGCWGASSLRVVSDREAGTSPLPRNFDVLAVNPSL